MQMIFGVAWMWFSSAHQRCFAPHVRRKALSFGLDSSQMSTGETPILKLCVQNGHFQTHPHHSVCLFIC